MTEAVSAQKLKANPTQLMTCYFVSLVLEGLQRVSGLLFLQTLECLKISRQSAVLPFTLSRAVADIIGPFSEALSKKQQPEPVVMWGALLATTGVGLCALRTNVEWLILFWGLIFGAGYGIASPHLSKVLQNHGHHKWTSAFCQTGPSIGAILIPLLLNNFIFHYGIHGSYLLMAGVILNYLPLSIATIYDIQFLFPKWRVRKRSKRYSISEQGLRNNPSSKVQGLFSNENFVNCLEPDLIHKIRHSCKKKDTSNLKQNITLIDIERYCSEETLNNPEDQNTSSRISNTDMTLQELNSIAKIMPSKRTLSEIVIDIQDYEKGRKLFEDSFYQHSSTSENSSLDIHDKGIKFPSEASDIKLEIVDETEETNKLPVSEKQIKELSTLENQNHSENIPPPELSADSSQSPNETKATQQNGDVKTSSGVNLSGVDKSVPLEIKVHVVECTFQSDSEFLYEAVEKLHMPNRKTVYRRHSNSLPSGCYDHIDFTTDFFKNNKKFPKFPKPILPRIYSISEDGEYEAVTENNMTNGTLTAQKKGVHSSLVSKAKVIAKEISKMMAPACLCILLTNIICEFSLITLITIFADYAKDFSEKPCYFKWILVAFGAGDMFGKLCFSHTFSRISKKAYVLATVLFVLSGLTTVGILWAPNLVWLAAFYCMLGTLESAIAITIPKLVTDYIEINAQTVLSSASKFLSGLAVLCMPFSIGITREDLGDYEVLLETISCFSILCAFLCCFLPRVSGKLPGNPSEDM